MIHLNRIIDFFFAIVEIGAINWELNIVKGANDSKYTVYGVFFLYL